MQDLWSPNIEVATLKSPVAFLKEQASLLGQKTKNIVIAQVEQMSTQGALFMYAFYLVAPAMQNYHYSLFSVSHNIDIYPVTFGVGGDLANELRIALGKEAPSSGPIPPTIVANNEAEFLLYLVLILRANKTTAIVNSLIAISNDTEGVVAPESPN